MDPTNQNNEFRNVPQDAEAFGMVRKDAEIFGTVPQSAEAFRNVPNESERKENHTLTVREVARLFEAAGVSRTERSIVNWCQPNKDGLSRLDSYFDPNERKYFITPQSTEAAIQEEKAKATKGNDVSRVGGSIPKAAETQVRNQEPAENPTRVKALEQEVMDLRITNRAKDFFIEQLKTDRQSLVQEQRTYVERLVVFSREIGELKTKLLEVGSAPEVEYDRPADDREIRSEIHQH